MKENNRTRITRDEFEKRKAERKQRILFRRAERVANAKRSLKEEDCPIRRMKAQHVLAEETIAQRIDDLKQELDDTRDRNRIELKMLREKTNGKKTRSQRRVDPEFINKTKQKITEIIENWGSDTQKSILDLLPDYKEHKNPNENIEPISYEEIGRKLNSQGHKTLYDRNWRRTTVIRFMERYMKSTLKKVGHEPNATQAAQDGLKAKVKAYDIYMRDEVLPMIDTSEKHHVIADQLKKRGIKTRLNKEWGNVSVGRMLKRIKEIKE